MTRVNAREIAVQILFGAEVTSVPVNEYASDFLSPERFTLLKEENDIYSDLPDEKSLKYINNLINEFASNKETVDSLISNNSRGWKLSRISGTALAAMRISVCEMLYFDDISNAVSINSALDIVKNYDDDDVVSFVNGVLGTISKSVMK